MRRGFVAVIVSAWLIALGALPSRGDQDHAATATTATTTTTRRPRDAIIEDLRSAMTEVRALLDSPDALLDERRRTEIAPRAVPAMRKAVAALDELAAQDPDARGRIPPLRLDLLAKLTLLGDTDAGRELHRQALAGEGKTPAAMAARTALLRAGWWKASGDAEAQQKLVDEARAMMKEFARNDALAMDLFELSTLGAASRDTRVAMEQVVIDHARGLRSTALIEQIEGIRRPRRLEGKPLTIKGNTVDGEPFDSSQWKGRIILVDFWATWCPPCVAAVPRLQALYEKYHARGLEIVGVNSDRTGGALRDFLAKHDKLTWPQLFDPRAPEMHPLALEYGVEQLPTMFLIDRNGVVTTVEARENFEQVVQRMIEEK